MSGYKLHCPRCPGCNEKGQAVVPGWPPNPEQLFCHNNTCQVITWNGTKTLQENMADPNWISLSIPGTNGPGQ